MHGFDRPICSDKDNPLQEGSQYGGGNGSVMARGTSTSYNKFCVFDAII